MESRVPRHTQTTPGSLADWLSASSNTWRYLAGAHAQGAPVVTLGRC